MRIRINTGLFFYIFFLTVFVISMGGSSFAQTITETVYYRSDNHVVNGLNARRLNTVNTEVRDGICFSGVTNFPGGIEAEHTDSVYIRHEDGTETHLVTDAAFTRRSGMSEGYQSAAWNCPEVTLEPTDAIKIITRMRTGPVIVTERTFVTEQLGAVKLHPTAWTFTRFTVNAIVGGGPIQWGFITCILHGAEEAATRIEGLSYEVYVDIGLRVFDGEEIKNIACDADAEPHRLRIGKADKIYGIVLVPISDPMASKIHIHDGTSVKALRLL